MCCSVLCHLGLFFLLVSEPAPLYSCSIERNEKIIFRHTPKRRNKMFISTEKYILIICIYLFLKQIFTKHLLCTWHNSRSWTYSSEWERKYFTFLKLISFVGRKGDVNTHTCICTCKCTQIYMTLWHITNCKFQCIIQSILTYVYTCETITTVKIVSSCPFKIPPSNLLPINHWFAFYYFILVYIFWS